jgi:hypothetical protein
MACESEWDAYQQAIADRIASEIVEQAAIAARQAAQMAEWTACMAWWYCGSGSRVVETHGLVPTLEESQLGKQAAEMQVKATGIRVEQLKLEFQRVTGKPYDAKANGGGN